MKLTFIALALVCAAVVADEKDAKRHEKAMEDKRKKWDELFPKIDTSGRDIPKKPMLGYLKLPKVPFVAMPSSSVLRWRASLGGIARAVHSTCRPSLAHPRIF